MKIFSKRKKNVLHRLFQVANERLMIYEQQLDDLQRTHEKNVCHWWLRRKTNGVFFFSIERNSWNSNRRFRKRNSSKRKSCFDCKWILLVLSATTNSNRRISSTISWNGKQFSIGNSSHWICSDFLHLIFRNDDKSIVNEK